jgi:RNA polymerase sigma-70 factor (ECF subfamily)
MNVRPDAASDEELALEAKSGSRGSFEELMARYGRRLGAYLRAKIASSQDVEDIVQETFLKLFRNIDRYDPRWKFSTWAYTAAGRLAISHYRTQAKAKKLKEAAELVPTASFDVTAGVSGANLWKTAQALPSSQYQALWLFYTEEMSIRDIARVMNRTSLAVRMLLHRGRLGLAALLGEIAGSETAVPPGERRPGMIVCLKENPK